MNIVLAVDNSPHSQVAVDVLMRRNWPDDGTFKVFCAIERRDPIFAVMRKEDAEQVQNKLLQAALDYTSDIANRLSQKFPKCKTINEVKFGDSKELILSQADWPADLVIVGSRGKRGLSRFLGSVSQTVLLYSPCSTLIARYENVQVADSCKNVLVAVDDSVHSRSVIEWVLSLPWSEDTRIVLLSVLPAIADKYSDGIDALYARKFSGDRLKLRRETQAFLDKNAARLKQKVVGKVTPLLREGDPAEEILNTAKTWPAGLIIIGSRSHGHLTRWFVGSVSQEVVLQAPCPVEVIKQGGPENSEGLQDQQTQPRLN